MSIHYELVGSLIISYYELNIAHSYYELFANSYYPIIELIGSLVCMGLICDDLVPLSSELIK